MWDFISIVKLALRTISGQVLAMHFKGGEMT